MNHLRKVAEDADYPMLHQQKQTLLSLVDTAIPEGDRENLDGLINFLDEFQDAVVGDGIAPEEEVFYI